MAKFQFYESLVCVAEIKQTSLCKQKFIAKMKIIAPYLQIQEVNLRLNKNLRENHVSGDLKMKSRWERWLPLLPNLQWKDEIQVKKYGKK